MFPVVLYFIKVFALLSAEDGEGVTAGGAADHGRRVPRPFWDVPRRYFSRTMGFLRGGDSGRDPANDKIPLFPVSEKVEASREWNRCLLPLALFF